jgi:anti-sigma factor RsiW
MNRNADCDENINAWLDGEAASAEREEIFAALGADPALERRACELRRVKALVRHAYEDIAPPAAALPAQPMPGVVIQVVDREPSTS